jgi:hypothetical protein
MNRTREWFAMLCRCYDYGTEPDKCMRCCLSYRWSESMVRSIHKTDPPSPQSAVKSPAGSSSSRASYSSSAAARSTSLRVGGGGPHSGEPRASLFPPRLAQPAAPRAHPVNLSYPVLHSSLGLIRDPPQPAAGARRPSCSAPSLPRPAQPSLKADSRRAHSRRAARGARARRECAACRARPPRARRAAPRQTRPTRFLRSSLAQASPASAPGSVPPDHSPSPSSPVSPTKQPPCPANPSALTPAASAPTDPLVCIPVNFQSCSRPRRRVAREHQGLTRQTDATLFIIKPSILRISKNFLP